MADRERSVWGWGWADAFPDRAARVKTGQMVSALLGGVALEAREPAREEDAVVGMGAPRVEVPASLSGFVTGAAGARVRHTYGRGYGDLVRGFAGRFEPAPDLVAYPEDEDAIWAVLDFATAKRLAVVPYGGGTSVVRGVEGETGPGQVGVVSLDMRRMDKVLEVDPVSRAARIQAGVLGPALEAQLGARGGFTLRHFPQSFEFSTLGGWIATRAGGHFATLYTHIDDLVEAVRMVTPRGVWESRRLPGSGAGPSPDRMVLGSEGVLGVITEAWMRVRPRPTWRAGASVKFRELGAAVAAVREIAQAELYPANCRLLDAREAMLHRVSMDGTNVLIVAFESADHPVDAWMARAMEIARTRGGVVEEKAQKSSGGADGWKSAFLEAPYLFNVLVSLGCVVDTFETACTWDRFEGLHAEVTSAVEGAMKRACGGGVMSMRFTHVYPDGPAPYYTFVAPGKVGGELEQWMAIKSAASDALIAGGATITHHHAVGRLHRPWYEKQRPEPFAMALRAAKAAVDPEGLLNPGVLLSIDP